MDPFKRKSPGATDGHTRKAAIERGIAAQTFWYHNIELAPGIWTRSQFHHSVPATRAIMGKLDLKEMRVVDIGAMDGLFSILALRRGAQSVVATDRLDLTTKVNFVKETLGVDFGYAPNIRLDHVGAQLKKAWNAPPDLTIYSGVLYHTFDPTGALITLRGLAPVDGLVIIETVAVIDDEAKLLYNDGFWIYSPGTYYVASTGWLGTMLPFTGLQPVDCRYFAFGQRHSKPVCRIAICCRAVEIPALASPPPVYASGAKSWYAKDAMFDFCEYLDVAKLKNGQHSRIRYNSAGLAPSDGNSLPVSSFFDRAKFIVDGSKGGLGLADVD